MDLNKINLLGFMELSRTELFIPIYQDKFKFNESICKKIYDIVTSESVQEFFIGSLVYKHRYIDGIHGLEIINLHQELITLSILLKYLSTHIDNEDNYLIYTLNNCLTKKYHNEDKNCKIIINGDEKYEYEQLILNNVISNHKSDINLTYMFFSKKINLNNMDLQKILENLKKIVALELKIDEYDNSIYILDSLKGPRDSKEYLMFIKKYIFVDLDIENVNRLYFKFWKKIEDNIEQNYFNKFMQSYLAIKNGNIPNESILFDNLIELFVDKICLEEILEEILIYSEVYLNIITNSISDYEIDLYIHELCDLNIKYIDILLLKIITDFKLNKIDRSSLINIMNYILSYFYRRRIMNISSHNNSKIIIGLINQINDKKYQESIIKYLLERNGESRFPNDLELTTYIEKNDKLVFHKQNKYFQYKNNKLKNVKDNFDITDILEYPNIKTIKLKDKRNILSYNWSNLNVNYVCWNNEEKKVKNITDIYKFLIEKIYITNPEKFNYIINGNKIGSKSFIAHNIEKLNGQYFEIYDTGILVNTKINSKRKKEFIQKLIFLLNLENENIEFIE